MTSTGDAIALLEVGHLTPALLAADVCAKAVEARIVGIESTNGAPQCIKLMGPVGDLRGAVRRGAEAARRMKTTVDVTVLPGPRDETKQLTSPPPQYSALLDVNDSLAPAETSMNHGDAIGLLETQGLVSALHATDEMLKSADVKLVGKEKIGGAYVTIVIRGDVAAVQTAVEVGRQTVGQLGGTLIFADVITRPHEELAALLPGM